MNRTYNSIIRYRDQLKMKITALFTTTTIMLIFLTSKQRERRKLMHTDRQTLELLLALPSSQDKRGVTVTRRVLVLAAAGRHVSAERIKFARDFMLRRLAEINARRPSHPPPCRGGL